MHVIVRQTNTHLWYKINKYVGKQLVTLNLKRLCILHYRGIRIVYYNALYLFINYCNHINAL